MFSKINTKNYDDFYDLNIKKVLEDWEPADAIREFIANALDETTISGAGINPEITKDTEGWWHIHDYGRGLKIENFAQNENKEKSARDDVIGKFGVGLNDAVAVLYRNNIEFYIISNGRLFFPGKKVKAGDSREETLHIFIKNYSEPNEIGTDIVIKCTDTDIEKAKSKFCAFGNYEMMDRNKHGQILKNKNGISKIYFNGVEIAEAEDFLFSYNITNANAHLKKALNRERKNVGKTAFAKKIEDILEQCKQPSVLSILYEQVKKHNTRKNELNYTKVEANVIINHENLNTSKEKNIYVTSEQLHNSDSAREILDMKEQDGLETIEISDKAYKRIEAYNESCVQENAKIMTLSNFVTTRSKSFVPEIIAYSSLTEEEKDIFDSYKKLEQVFPTPKEVQSIKIAKQLYTKEELYGTVGLWNPEEKTIYILKDQLISREKFLGTLYHEFIHAKTGFSDVSRQFENQLTQVIGLFANQYIDSK